MTNAHKINRKQKELMAQFMADHPNLAKNLIPNCGQGKPTAQRLLEDISNKFNSYGPPVKNASVWRKVYADQKHNGKKKLSFNKASKEKTGGGPYEEMILSPAEEQIIQAAGIEAAVEGIPSVKTFGSAMNTKETMIYIEDSLNAVLDHENLESEDMEKETPRLQ